MTDQMQLFAEAESAIAAPESPRYAPDELAALLGLHPPTPQQVAVITAPLAPLSVIAGAGSGKTETMAARVVYLVANSLVRPEQVLGLTFTRKAAGELASRIRVRLTQLARTAEFAEVAGTAPGRSPASSLGAGEPTVATYHSYAGRIAAEHGLRAGFEPSERMLTEAACWQLADKVVRNYDGDMSDVEYALDTVVAAVLDLAGDMAEHLCTPAQVGEWTAGFLTAVDAKPGRIYEQVRKALSRQRVRQQLLPLVEAYLAAKRSDGAVDFADQLVRAALVARDFPQVGLAERDRFRVVLLDEYQDTSHAQVVMLRALFGGGHPVTAVGDPCQSIYAWRGASAGTIERFPHDFPARRGFKTRALPLTVSWRNAPQILRLANAISAPLRGTGTALKPAPGRANRDDAVRCALLETAQDEADWVADQLAAVWSPTATAAILVRARRQIPLLEAALRARGLPTEVVGLGGLLDTPEVREIIAVLQVLADPTAGGAVLRLLTGARWRLGPRDVVALYRRARDLARERDRRARELVRERAPDAARDAAMPTDALDEAALAEALDDLGDAGNYSSAGYLRLRRLNTELTALRGRVDQPLPDLVGDVERTLGLDIEVAARSAGATSGAGAEVAETSSAGGPAGPSAVVQATGAMSAQLARTHLDAFADVAAQFAAESSAPLLSPFLAYLTAAELQERGLEPGHVDVIRGAVQLLSVHAAKGLEWDTVAVAGLVKDVFPARAQSDHWLSRPGALPFALRGDRGGLPQFELDAAEDGPGVLAALKDFDAAWRDHSLAEERRLAYVAVTRPRELLLCSGYWWDKAAKGRRGPSMFLTEAAEIGEAVRWTDEPAEDATNPLLVEPAQALWPIDPLGERRNALTQAADLVRSAMADSSAGGEGADPKGNGERLASELSPAEGAEAARWAADVDLLLVERALARSTNNRQVTLPDRLSVSQLVALRRDPELLAQRLRRPLPIRPNPQARRGTAFHRWLEQRYGGDRLLDLDELPGAADADAAPDEVFTALRDAFEASAWADRVPHAVEVPFSTVWGGVVIRGRMDAVFAEPDGTFQVIDWKTGQRPDSFDADAVQLAAYRLAWAELAGVSLAQVRAGFHYVHENTTVRPVDLLDTDGLTELITQIPIDQN